ncbi:MAG: class I SAM-dependent methyltransferase [Solirubrobacterales bacterium]
MAQKLNWGCGDHLGAGWINSDVKDGGGVDLVADIRRGLPLSDACIDYAVSIHALPELSIPTIEGALAELLRVLKPEGVLRLALPDLRLSISAFEEGEEDFFKIDPDAAKTLDGRFIRHVLWYGYTRTLFTPEFARELLEGAGFVEVTSCEFGATSSRFTDIVELDNRGDESFFIEGSRAADDRPGSAYNAAVVQPQPITVSEIVHLTPTDDVRGRFRIEQSGSTLELVGWALGSGVAVDQVSVVSGGRVVARSPVVLERPDIKEAFPKVDGADTCGFKLALEPLGEGNSNLLVQAELQDGNAVPLGELQVQTARRRRKGLFGFGR